MFLTCSDRRGQPNGVSEDGRHVVYTCPVAGCGVQYVADLLTSTLPLQSHLERTPLVEQDLAHHHPHHLPEMWLRSGL